MSLMFDNNNNRISSFIKRLLEMCLISEPPFIICNLIIISQVIRNKNKLWKMMEREQSGVKLFYDSTKRDPQFAQGEYSFLNELYLLEKHYHPSVQRMAKFILDNYNKDIISYNGDPLLDFSLTNFLEKFMLKNPKIKKEKKEIKKITNDDDELKKFIQGDEDNNNKENKNITMDENDLEFIDKFNKIYPEITNDKNYLKKMKKKEKKMRTEEDVDEMIGDQEYTKKENEDSDLENYADKVIDEEYKKFGKDIDDDNDLIENDLENNNNEEEEVDDLFTEDENEDMNENEENKDLEENEDNEIEEEEIEENDNKKGNKKNKKKKDSGFVDAETYYNNLKNKRKK